MKKSQANIDQLERQLAEALEEIEQYKAQEKFLLLRLKKAEGGINHGKATART